MEVFTLIIVVVAYIDIKENLKKILNYQSKNNKKDFSLLGGLIGKNIQVELDDEYALVFGNPRKGILKEFNDTWFILESTNKKKTEFVYYRINEIKGVSEIH